MLDTAKLVRQQGLKSVMVSNGYINREPMLELAPHLDAVKIDLKGFLRRILHRILLRVTGACPGDDQARHRPGQVAGDRLSSDPTVNDDPKTIRAVAQWVTRVGGPDIPLHFSRFMPAFRLKNLPRELEGRGTRWPPTAVKAKVIH